MLIMKETSLRNRRVPSKVRERPGKNGMRYQALYLPEPDSAAYVAIGTFGDWETANAAAGRQVDRSHRGIAVNPQKGRTLFGDFAELWHDLYIADRANTISNVEDHLRLHIIPFFGKMRLCDIEPLDAQRWIKKLTDEGKTSSSIRTYRGTLSGVFSQAVYWEYMERSPLAGSKPPKQGERRIRAYERSDADALIAGCPGDASGLLVRTALNSGARWGEITELRGGDVHEVDPEEYDDDIPEDVELVFLELRRSVSDVGMRRTGGSRFHVEPTTKGRRDRKVSLDPKTSKDLLDHIQKYDIGPEDLVFPLSLVATDMAPTVEDELKVIPGNLGRTEPNEQGRTYAHGTATAYGPGKCRCEWCHLAVAQYRARRRAEGKDLKPRKETRGTNLTDHLPRDWFRRNIYMPAVKAAGITGKASFHDLRHTHATWLAKDGIPVEILRRRLGHSLLTTTQLYIDDATEVDTTAAMVMARLMSKPVRKVRRRRQLTVVGE